jgi:hypothetical protein
MDMISSRKAIALVAMVALAAASLAYVFATQLQTSFHGVGVLKSADSFAYIGDMVAYHIKVYNPSDYDLHSINVTDPMLGLNETIPFMEASNETGIAYTLHRTVLETDPNPLVNTVHVEAIDSGGVYSSASTQAITVITERMIEITKVGPETAYTGERIAYTISVNNTGDTDLYGVVVEDEMLGFRWTGDLTHGEINVFNLTYAVPWRVKGNLTNTVATWAVLNETTYYAEASWTTRILHPCITCPRSMGYWKNHREDWPAEEIEVGNVTYSKEEALSVLIGANAKDATRMLSAQLIAAKLNRLNGASSSFYYKDGSMDIDGVISDADSFLTEHPSGSNPQGDYRQTALHLKDMLDAYNNGDECD